MQYHYSFLTQDDWSAADQILLSASLIREKFNISDGQSTGGYASEVARQALHSTNLLRLLTAKQQAAVCILCSFLINKTLQFMRIVAKRTTYSQITRSIFATALLAPSDAGGAPPLFAQIYEDLCRSSKNSHNPPPHPRGFNALTMLGRRDRTFEKSLSPDAFLAIKQDNVAAFDIHRSLSNLRIGRQCVRTLLKYSAFKILAYQLENISAKVFLLSDLLFYCASNSSRQTLGLIDAIESHQPGFVQSARDIYGNNALWYCLHYLGEMPQDPCVASHLIELGCAPNAPNCYGLTYNSMIKAREFFNEI